MTTPRRYPSRASLAALLVALAVSTAACDGGSNRHAVVPAGELPDQEVSDFVLTETDQGRPQWTLYARSASTFTAQQLIRVRGVRVDFFGEDGKRSSELTAREGEIHQERRDMLARGGVVLSTAEGTRMTTEELEYLNLANKIRSDRLVRVERQGDVLEGVGFESDPALEHFEFRTKVRATVRNSGGVQLETREGPK